MVKNMRQKQVGRGKGTNTCNSNCCRSINSFRSRQVSHTNTFYQLHNRPSYPKTKPNIGLKWHFDNLSMITLKYYGSLEKVGMIFNVTKRRENKHTDKPHDWKRGKRRQTRKESASYVSRLFLILKVFWTYSSSPQLCVSHDMPAML